MARHRFDPTTYHNVLGTRDPVLRIAEPQGAHVLQQRRFAQDPPEQAGRERRQGMVLQHATAEPIDHGDGAAAGERRR